MRGGAPEESGRSFDLIVIGAGINGAGIARDAAMRGLRVLVLDKGDICNGTTAWSTRLIHGGLRYLEYLDVALVRESLREREHLLKLAPHLVRPLRLILPIYRGHGRGPVLIRTGLFLYDLLSWDGTLPGHRMLTVREALALAPGLNPGGLRGAAMYYDAQVEYPERLVLENVLSAVSHGATGLTYAKVERILVERRAVTGVEFVDLIAGKRFNVLAPAVVNAGGPWVDEVLEATQPQPKRLMGGTKGSHIVVGAFAGAPEDGLYVEAAQDRRPFFILPWNGQFLIGTTDVHYEGTPDCLTADDNEVDYLLRETNRVIPRASLTRANILYTYSGLRPLPYRPGREEGGISRRHIIHDHAPRMCGLLSLVGGKITTYRNLAEQVVDVVFRKLRRTAPPCRTGVEPLPGAGEWQVEADLPPAAAARLPRLYGGRARAVLSMARTESALSKELMEGSGVLGAEVVFAFREEMAQTLEDVLMRRTMAGLSPGMAVGLDIAAADIAVRFLGWDRKRAVHEVDAYRSYLDRFRPAP